LKQECKMNLHVQTLEPSNSEITLFAGGTTSKILWAGNFDSTWISCQCTGGGVKGANIENAILGDELSPSLQPDGGGSQLSRGRPQARVQSKINCHCRG